jgi:hypothetical protein
MNYQTIIGKTVGIQHSCAVELSHWLELWLLKAYSNPFASPAELTA